MSELGGGNFGGEACSAKVGVSEIGGTVEGENKLQLHQADLRGVRGGEEEMREEE